jgi:Spy/CpxP family protein refolding chaperone
MKNKYLNSGKTLLLITMAFISVSTQAQRGYGMRQGQAFRNDSLRPAHAMLNLTDDQQKKMDELRTSHLKEMTSFRNDLAIKEAELQKYKSADKPDVATINKTIDEMGKISTEMMKKKVAHQLAVQNLLTEEQKAIFNSRPSTGKFGGPGGGMHERDGGMQRPTMEQRPLNHYQKM